MPMSKLDYAQVIRSAYDESAEALKTTIQNTEIAIELSATDGDSVTTYVTTVAATATTGTAIACDQYKKIAVYSVAPTGLLVEASPDNITWVTIDNTNATYIIKDLCAKYVRLTFSSGTVKYVLQS